MRTNHFSKKITIQEEHLDTLNHVNNVQYVTWIQDIAVDHWMQVTGIENSKDQYWVVHEHTIRYKKQVFLGEKLTVKTFVEPYEGVRFPRVVQFCRGDELVVEARTFWILLDGKDRPKMLDAETLALFGL